MDETCRFQNFQGGCGTLDSIRRAGVHLPMGAPQPVACKRAHHLRTKGVRPVETEIASLQAIATSSTLETTDGDSAGPDDPRYRWILLALVMLALMTFGSLMTIVTVSLGEIGDDLGASRSTMTWAITGLLLATALGTPIAGTLGDIYGHRRMVLLGLASGAVLTAASGLAWNAASLIAFRVAFGLFSSMVSPNAVALMMHAFGADRRATAMGWYQFAVTGAPTIGLVIGGPLIDVLGWRVLFFGFAGISFLAFVIGLVVIRPTPRSEGRPLDLPGATTLTLGVLAGLLAITRITAAIRDESIGAAVTDPISLVLLAGLVVGIRAFVSIEQRSAAPMLPIRYFRRRDFSLPMLTSATMQFAYMGGFVITPALLEGRYLWTVGGIALLMAPRPGAFSLSSLLGGYLPSRIGLKIPTLMGPIAMMISMAAFIAASPLTSGLGIGLILVGLVMSGVSSGIAQPSIAALVVGAVDEGDVGIANGMNQQITMIGIIVGIQTMNVLVGDDASGGRFAATYLVGFVVATVGLAAAFAIRGEASRTRSEASAT